MKQSRKSDRVKIKIGSFEWLNFFGLPAFLICISFIDLYFYLKDIHNESSHDFLLFFVLTIIFGIVSYFIQFQRLYFKTFNLTKDQEHFKIQIRQLLKEDNWEIEFDNKQYLQATFRGGIFNLDMLTLKYRKSEIQWNVIHHPRSHNSIAAVFTWNKQGKKIIRKIRACA